MIFEKQDFQQECIFNIISLLKDDDSGIKFDFKKHNNLSKCLKNFHSKFKLPVSTLSGKNNIDILMETGTGKTFTYLNLIYELHKNFNQNKFIIFVPRKAILESVKQNITLTKDYFYQNYQKHLTPYFYSDTKSQSSIINHYIKNQDELSVLVLTNSAIDKKSNILNRQSEGLFGSQTILESIAELNPICIIDEPHLLKGDKFNEYFGKISALYFRFGATFPTDKGYELSNLAFCLDSQKAFQSYLVKQIVVSAIDKDNQNPKLLSVNSKNKTAEFSHFINNVKRITSLKFDDDLGTKLSFKEWSGVNIANFKSQNLYLTNGKTIMPISGGGGGNYTLSKSEISYLLSESIDKHFKKEQILFKENIKTLSLFFIPSIADFRGKDAFIKDEFERLYKEKRKEILKQNLDPAYRAFLEKDFDKDGVLQVAQGYFSGDHGNKDEKEAAGVKIILEEKEKLLSFETPLRFIFSVWALQEGWDNPNIFILTKLASSTSETSRHQQIGRGLRLCVNANGNRITKNFCANDDEKFFAINSLDVFVSGAEQGFIEGLQKEINESSFGANDEFLNSKILSNLGLNEREISRTLNKLEDIGTIEFDKASDHYIIKSSVYDALQNEPSFKTLLGENYQSVLSAFKPSKNRYEQVKSAFKNDEKVKIRKDNAQSFKELWKNINKKAEISYRELNKNDLINAIAVKFNQTRIDKKIIKIETKTLDAKQNKIILNEEREIKTEPNSSQKRVIFDDICQNLVQFAKDNFYSLPFILEIFSHLERQNFLNDPQKALENLKKLIKDEIHKNMLAHVAYNFGADYTFGDDDLLFDKDGKPRDEIKAHILGRDSYEGEPPQHYLYDRAFGDSQIEKDSILQSPQKR